MDDQNLQVTLAVVALGLAALGLLVALVVVLRRMRTARSAVAGEFTQARLDGLAVWQGEGGSSDRRPGQ
jgi:hypothetical protein